MTRTVIEKDSNKIAQGDVSRLIGCVGVDPGKTKTAYGLKIGQKLYEPALLDIDSSLPVMERNKALRKAISVTLRMLMKAYPEVTEWHLQVEDQYINEGGDETDNKTMGGRFGSVAGLCVCRGYWEQAAEMLGWVVHAPIPATIWQKAQQVTDMARHMPGKTPRTRGKQASKFISEKLLGCKIKTYDECDAIMITDYLSVHIGVGKAWTIKTRF